MPKCPICGESFLHSFHKANDGTQVCDAAHKIAYNKILLQGGGSSSKGAEKTPEQIFAEEQIEREKLEARRAEEKAEAADRAVKAEVFEKQGKKLTALVVRVNPTYWIIVLAAIFYGFILNIFVGIAILLAILTFAFFLIKEYFELGKKEK